VSGKLSSNPKSVTQWCDTYYC